LNQNSNFGTKNGARIKLQRGATGKTVAGLKLFASVGKPFSDMKRKYLKPEA
jgi:hypothetical protein